MKKRIIEIVLIRVVATGIIATASENLSEAVAINTEHY